MQVIYVRPNWAVVWLNESTEEQGVMCTTFTRTEADFCANLGRQANPGVKHTVMAIPDGNKHGWNNPETA